MSQPCVPDTRLEIGINRSISKYNRNPKYLRKEANRLKTFRDWPVSFIDRKKLAKDGFYYTTAHDVVRCAFCLVDIGYWVPGDDVRENHRAASPGCPMVSGLPCENIAKTGGQNGSESDSDSDSELEREMGTKTEFGIDVSGPYEIEIMPFSAPEKPCKDSLLTAGNYLCKYFEHYGVSKVTGPIAPQFAVYEARLATYNCWNYSEIQKPEKLARAGFYHIASGDQVLCFYCGAGLHKWKAEDEPWLEHARYSFQCGFVILQKGPEFIRDAIETKNMILITTGVKKIRSNPEDPSESRVEIKAPVRKILSNPQQPPAIPIVEPEERINDFKDCADTSDDSEIDLCRICYVRKREIVFLPCGHFISCNFCASSFSACALCRTKFEAVVRSSLDAEGEGADKCVVCKTAQREVVFLPCGHFISCSNCVKPKTSCALCRKRYKLLVRAYLS